MREALEFLYAEKRSRFISVRLRKTLERWKGYIRPGPFQIGVEMHDEADTRLRQEIEEALK